MELDLQVEEWKCCSSVMDSLVRREESLEAIVPDSMPDVDMILSSTATPMLRKSWIGGDTMHCDAEIEVSVIYQAEGSGGVQSLTLHIPIHYSAEDQRVDESCQLQVTCCVSALNIRVMNSRKILANAELTLHLRVFRDSTLRYVTGIRGQTRDIQIRTEPGRLTAAVSTTEKRFPIEDEIALTSHRQPLDTLLGYSATPYCSEAKVVGSRVIFKGGLSLHIKLRRADGTLFSQWDDFPVSQVMDAGGADEDSNPQVDLTISSLQVDLMDEEHLAISGELIASAVLYGAREVQLLTDAYSTESPSAVETGEVEQLTITEDRLNVIPFRQIIDQDTMTAEVMDDSVLLTDCVKTPQGESGVQMQLSVVLRDSSGALTRVERSCTVPMNGPICALPQLQLMEASCVSAAGGMELRGKLQYHAFSVEASTLSNVSRIELMERSAEDRLEQPSAVLRMLRPGETLWELGKEYYATVADILSVNQISDEGSAQGKFLLIPRNR